jgi:hypothetical protein
MKAADLDGGGGHRRLQQRLQKRDREQNQQQDSDLHIGNPQPEWALTPESTAAGARIVEMHSMVWSLGRGRSIKPWFSSAAAKVFSTAIAKLRMDSAVFKFFKQWPVKSRQCEAPGTGW